MVTIRNRRKQVVELRCGGQRVKDPRRIKQEARRLFMNLYHQKADEIEKQPIMKEIKEAIRLLTEIAKHDLGHFSSKSGRSERDEGVSTYQSDWRHI
ncbi:hypothetical protein AHAS_Ahas18G0284000 [Arachis hypogaea]